MPRFTLPNNITLILLGFVSGLPLALTAGTLQAWLTVENVDIKTIGFFSLVGQAYVLKFLWSPMMDRYTPPFLGRRRGWLLTTQILLIISIAAMGFMNPSEHLWYLAALAVTVAFCSASQDIVLMLIKLIYSVLKNAELVRQPPLWGTGSACSFLVGLHFG